MVEHAVIEKMKRQGYSLLNKIASPGKNLPKLSKQQEKQVNKLANELIKELKKSSSDIVRKK